jgi:hypothetical protein
MKPKMEPRSAGAPPPKKRKDGDKAEDKDKKSDKEEKKDTKSEEETLQECLKNDPEPEIVEDK